MPLKWKREHTELLISSIQQYPCLYDIKSFEYLDKAKKAQAFNNILEELRNSMSTIALEDVKRKWKTIRTQYAYEQRMIHHSKTSCGTFDYAPKLWCFGHLYFLNSNTKYGQSGDNVKENDEEDRSNSQTGSEDESIIEELPHKEKRVEDVKEVRSNQKCIITKVDHLKFEENKCRICFEEDLKVDWNDCLPDNKHLTYKDCYYKYTQLNCLDGDNLYLSAMLCCRCSNSLENINAFITRAIESHKLLKERLALNIETTNFGTILISEADIKPEIRENSPTYEGTRKEYLNEKSHSCNKTETSTKKSRTKRKRKSFKEVCEQDNTKTSSHKLQSGKAIAKKNDNCTKRLETPTCCSICSKILASKYKAIQHEKIHTENRERNEICSKCGMKFFDKVSLKSHMLTHLENREKSHKCEFCDKAFYNTGGLNIHRRIHLGQMIQCSLCTKEYYRQIDLDNHMVSHSTARINGDVKPKKKYFVRCDVCEVTIRSSQYKSHSAKHMNEPLAKCAICDKEFFSRDSCITHLKIIHKKGRGERSNFVIGYKTTRYSNLFLQQNIGNIFTKE